MRGILFAAGAVMAAAFAMPAPAAPPGAAATADDPITFEHYRAWRLTAAERRRSEVAVRLSAADLTAQQKTRLEETRAYYDWLIRLPDSDRDRLFRERFDRIDANHDGKLDADERALWRDKQRAFYKRDRAPRHDDAEAAVR
jgi:hypothetical protein